MMEEETEGYRWAATSDALFAFTVLFSRGEARSNACMKKKHVSTRPNACTLLGRNSSVEKWNLGRVLIISEFAGVRLIRCNAEARSRKSANSQKQPAWILTEGASRLQFFGNRYVYFGLSLELSSIPEIGKARKRVVAHKEVGGRLALPDLLAHEAALAIYGCG